MKAIQRFLPVIISLISITPVWALQEGDQAPAVQVSKWLTGSAVESIGQKSERVIVITFWATWSQPACDSLKPLAALQNELGSKVTIIAISSEELDKVQEYVQKNLADTPLTIAVDTQQQTSMAYLRAFGLSALPHAFVINREGVLAWQGHPDDLREVVNKVLAGEFKIQAQPRIDRSKPALHPSIDPQAPLEKLVEQYQDALQDEDWSLAVQLIDLLVPKFPVGSEQAEQLLSRKFMLLYENLHQFDEAETFAREILEQHSDQPGLLNNIAWSLLARGNFETLAYRWPQLAHELADKAFAARPEDATIQDTYARSRFMLGDLAGAIKQEQAAIDKYQKEIDQVKSQPDTNPEQVGEMEKILSDMKASLEYYTTVQKMAQPQ
ncbi:MAG: hypothetical protein HJJLKODD_02952 [Phycisphaerae bacterium]|nr:hypothetical protein [Phycisphaerae bacterium]